MFRYVGRGGVFIWRQGDVPSLPPDPGPGPPDTVPPGTLKPQRRFEIRFRGGRFTPYTAWRATPSTPAQSYSYAATGGLVLSGSAAVQRSQNILPTGGLTFGGEALISTGPEAPPPVNPPGPEVIPTTGMLRDRAVENIAARLGFRSDLNSIIISELQIVQAEELEQDNEFKPWFLFKDRTDLVTVPGQDWVALPDDFLLQIDDVWLYYKEPEVESEENFWRPVLGSYMSQAISWEHGGTYSRPVAASIQGRRIYLRPVVSQALELRFLYFAAEPQLATNITNNWLRHASEWLVAATTAKIAAAYLQDDKAAALQASLAAAARKRLWMKSETLMNTGMYFIKGGED